MPTSPSLHHLALGAANVESLAPFYRDVVGLPETVRRHYEDGTQAHLFRGRPILDNTARAV